MKALLLAAGLGERVRPLTEKIPKPMLEVGGQPLIHYPLAMLAAAGITEAVINVHHLAGLIRQGLGDGKSLGVGITYAPEPVLLGTGGPLNGLRDYFANETFVLANSDTILDLDLGAMIGFHRGSGAVVTMLLSKADRPSLRERIEIDRDGRIRRMRLLKSRDPVTFDDYPRELEGIEPGSLDAYMYSGVIILEPALLESIPKATPWSLMTGLIGPAIARGAAVFGFAYDGYFRTVDDLATYYALVREFETSPPNFRHLRLNDIRNPRR